MSTSAYFSRLASRLVLIVGLALGVLSGAAPASGAGYVSRAAASCPVPPEAGDANGNGVADQCEAQRKPDNRGCYETSDTVAPPDGTQPDYLFEDISASGAELTLEDDELSEAVELGFGFRFYGKLRSALYVSSNGFLTFDAESSIGCCKGGPIPSPDSPNDVIAGFWTDLNPEGGGHIRYQTLGEIPSRRFLVQFDAVPLRDGSRNVTFELVLFEGTNVVEVRYADASNGQIEATGGIENDAGSAGYRWAGPHAIELAGDSVRYSPTGLALADTDSDDVVDCLDNCPQKNNPEQSDCDGDGIGDACDEDAADTDGDGIAQPCDNCPDVANASQADADGDGFGDACDTCASDGAADGDLDGICDEDDDCPTVANAAQFDCDRDGLGDACDPDTIDADGDGIDLSCDNCADVPNPDQADADQDRFGDACDTCTGSGTADRDGDGYCDEHDNCPDVANPAQADCDEDYAGDACDEDGGDTDGDLIDEPCDNCPDTSNPDQHDADSDGYGDACDTCPGLGSIDSDGDGACDENDNCPFLADASLLDCDLDGIGDACDAEVDPAVADSDGDERCRPDDNCPDLANHDQQDNNGSGVGDVCEAQQKPDNGGCYVASDTLSPPDGTEPVYTYDDITQTGTRLGEFEYASFSDPVSLEFPFEFYGQTYNRVSIASSGFLTFLVGSPGTELEFAL